MIQVQDLRAQLRSQGRRLKNIHVLVSSVADFTTTLRQGGKKDKQLSHLRTAAFDLTSAYSADELASLQSTDSIPSITLGPSDDKSGSCIWEPPPHCDLPVRRMTSELSIGMPPKDSAGFYRSQNQVIPFATKSTMSILNTTPDRFGRRSTAKGLLEIYSKGIAEVGGSYPVYA